MHRFALHRVRETSNDLDKLRRPREQGLGACNYGQPKIEPKRQLSLAVT